MATNEREFIRVTLAIHVELRFEDNLVISGELENVSLNGLILRAKAKVSPQAPCLVVIHLDGGAGGPTIQAKGVVARTTPDKVAVQFQEILGNEGMIHLRNLVLYNSGRYADQVETEFHDHVGLKPIS